MYLYIIRYYLLYVKYKTKFFRADFTVGGTHLHAQTNLLY